jgi:hypothetical protein
MNKMKKKQSGGLGNDMGKLLERKEKQAKTQSETNETTTQKQAPIKHVLDPSLIESLFNNAKDQPRISFWDLESKVILGYLRETEPKFSISGKISTILHEYFQKEYPELWSEVEDLKEKE